jgi:hypothetical protein
VIQNYENLVTHNLGSFAEKSKCRFSLKSNKIKVLKTIYKKLATKNINCANDYR